MRRNPYSIVLFDEIQKADEDVIFLLLQILEEGKISDSSGKVIDFSNAIIIFTTNVGNQTIITPTIGFNNSQKNIEQDIFSSLKKYFAPDFLNRIDEIITFNPLKNENISIIINKELEKLKQNLLNRKIEINFDSDLSEYILAHIQFDNFGARQVLKTIQREVETLIAEKIFENNKVSKLKIFIEKNKICVT
jgi:ATP-dependent Clp protease ATP-binding subunit ClpB